MKTTWKRKNKDRTEKFQGHKDVCLDAEEYRKRKKSESYHFHYWNRDKNDWIIYFLIVSKMSNYFAERNFFAWTASYWIPYLVHHKDSNFSIS